jgi:hypothetical protein
MGTKKMYNRDMDYVPEEDYAHVIDPLGLAPFSKEISQDAKREVDSSEVFVELERQRWLEKGDF